jgi:hypothetical protein
MTDLQNNPVRDLNNARNLPAADCPRCEAGDDNFANLLRNRGILLEENRALQNQLAAVNDQLLEAQSVIRTLKQHLREEAQERGVVEIERDNALALLRNHK